MVFVAQLALLKSGVSPEELDRALAGAVESVERARGCADAAESEERRACRRLKTF